MAQHEPSAVEGLQALGQSVWEACLC